MKPSRGPRLRGGFHGQAAIQSRYADILWTAPTLDDRARYVRH